ncbi:MAG: YhdH/YhfP family quinone oxidoreductase [Bacteroidales bacterium]|nr:YhdH/YhfP family quinone oxidoreductase [Bacteroidales bacterium]
MSSDFRAYRVFESHNNTFEGKIVSRNTSDLPANGVLIRVKYSGLNYKDALSASGNKGVSRKYPHTPGIDAAGIIEESDNTDYSPGDNVIVTSYDLGMNTDGGFGQYIKVPADWIVPLPDKMSLRESMIFGTAGLTAAQGLFSMLHNGQQASNGSILITGARGAVGGIAVMIASKLGFDVHAGVSKSGQDDDKLLELGASSVVDANQTSDSSGRPMLRSKWAGAIDIVGGNTLATILKSVSYGGNVVTVGNIESFELNTTVFPFILNGVNLLGIGSQDTPMALRRHMWNNLASEWKPDKLEDIVTEIGLDQLKSYLKIMISMKSRGRILLNLDN